jgi:hypothetical protein
MSSENGRVVTIAVSPRGTIITLFVVSPREAIWNYLITYFYQKNIKTTCSHFHCFTIIVFVFNNLRNRCKGDLITLKLGIIGGGGVIFGVLAPLSAIFQL